MSIEIASWNINNALGSMSRFPIVEEGIRLLESDVVILSEAWQCDEDSEEGRFWDIINEVREMGIEQGYTSFAFTRYEDELPRQDLGDGVDQYLVVLGKEALEDYGIVRLDVRNAIHLKFRDPTSRECIIAMAVHMDNRTESQRRAMAKSMLEILDSSREYPERAVIMGDLSAMHEDDPLAKTTRRQRARDVVSILPGRLKDRGIRFLEMGEGRALKRLSDEGFEDADPTHKPTFSMGGIAIAQLDHLLVRGVLEANVTQVKFRGFRHKALKAILEIDEDVA